MQIVCSASENGDIPLRRSEKKVLNINLAVSKAQLMPWSFDFQNLFRCDLCGNQVYESRS